MTYIDLTMTPNPPSPWRQQRIALALVGGVMALAAVRFLVLGAWMVLPFLLLDAGLLWWALNASTQAGRARETVRLDEADLTVRRVSAGGVERTVRLAPADARLEVEGHGAALRLWLSGPAARVRLGEFLGAAERAEVQRVVEAGLWRWRRARR